MAGFVAMGSPYLFSILIAQWLGIAALVIGGGSLAMAIFGKHRGHRFAEGHSGVIRIIAGIILLRCIGSSVAIITLILAVYLAVEGLVAIFGALKLRGNAGWTWSLINGLVSLILALMVFARWPNNSVGILGLLFGIHTLFSGVSLLMPALRRDGRTIGTCV